MKPFTELTFEQRAEAVLSCAFYGIHHCPEIKKESHGEFARWEVNTHGMLSTFDSDCLTRLVLAAHEQCVRVSIQNSGPRLVKIVIHPRQGREGSFSQRHQDIETALKSVRDYFTKYEP